MKNIFLSTSALVFIASIVQAQVSIITGITSTPAFGSPETNNVVLESYTTASGTFNYDFTVASIIGTAPTASTWGTAGVQPTDATAALLDDSPMTGNLSTPDNIIYNFGQSVTASDEVFVIFNGSFSVNFFDANSSITAVDSVGSTVGSPLTVTITQSDNFGTSNLDRSNGGTLFGRGLWGWSANIADFGGDASTISGVVLGAASGGANRVDIQMVGVGATIPEPETYAMLFGVATVGLVALRRHR